MATKDLPKTRGADSLHGPDAGSFPRHIGSEGPVFSPQRPQVDRLPHTPGTMTCDVACAICPAFNLLCCGAKEGDAGAEGQAGKLHLAATVHTIPARRLILHPKEWSDFVPIICSGWAMSSVALPDGRRQIISFLLPGDLVSAGSLLAPMSGHTVEAITEVT